MDVDRVDRAERAQILEGTEAAAARRYEVSPYCWIGSIVVVTLTTVALVALDAVSLARLDSALDLLRSARAAPAATCAPSQLGLALTTYNFFDEDKLYYKYRIEVDNQLQRDIADFDYSEEYAFEVRLAAGIDTAMPPDITCEFGTPAANDKEDDDDDYITDSAFYADLDEGGINLFCSSLTTSESCNGLLPTSTLMMSWLSTLAIHRLRMMEAVKQIESPTCRLAQSHYTTFLNRLKENVRNPCAWRT